MPIYEYQCATCECVFDIDVSMSDHSDPDECPECDDGEVKRLYRHFGIQYRGMGFYTTDTGR